MFLFVITHFFFLINILKYSKIVTQINLIISTSEIKLKNNLKRRSFDEEMISRRFSTREKWPPERFLATLKCNSVNTRENEVIFAKIKQIFGAEKWQKPLRSQREVFHQTDLVSFFFTSLSCVNRFCYRSNQNFVLICI